MRVARGAGRRGASGVGVGGGSRSPDLPVVGRLGTTPYRWVMASLGEQEASPDPRPPAPGEVLSSMHDKTIPGKNRTGG